jgi:hypothetical protein
MSHIKIVYGDDWECLYENDQVVTQNEQISIRHWYLLGQRNPDIPFGNFVLYVIDNEYLDSLGILPSNFNEIPKDKLKE